MPVEAEGAAPADVGPDPQPAAAEPLTVSGKQNDAGKSRKRPASKQQQQPGAANGKRSKKRSRGAAAKAPKPDAVLRGKMTQMVTGQAAGAAITMAEVTSDVVMGIASKHWGVRVSGDTPFRPDLVRKLYNTELGGGGRRRPALRRIMLLEVSQYLERYLWPRFDPAAATPEHVMSVIVMVNEKFREGVPAWTCFNQHEHEAKWPGFIERVLALAGGRMTGPGAPEAAGRLMHLHERTAYLLFVIHLFQSLETERVRTQMLRLVTLPVWCAISESRRALELHEHPELLDRWKKLAKRDKKAAKSDPNHVPMERRPEATFVAGLVDDFLELLDHVLQPQVAEVKEEEMADGEGVEGADDDDDDDDDDENDNQDDAGGDAAEDGGEDGLADADMADVVQHLGDEPDVGPDERPPGLENGAPEDLLPEPSTSGAPADGSDTRRYFYGPDGVDRAALHYCERFVELLIDMMSQLPTRRFVRALLGDRAVLVKCRLCPLYRHEAGVLFAQLLDLFQFYLHFNIDDHTGEGLTDEEVEGTHYERIQQLQRLLFQRWEPLKELAFSNCASVQQRSTLRSALASLPHDQLLLLVTKQLRLVDESDPWAVNRDFLVEVFVSHYERRQSQREAINAMPLYPTEAMLWDEHQIPTINYTGEGVLALPKLNLQFLTFHDYLLRNFNLFRLEATYEIREDVVNVLKRVRCSVDRDRKTHWLGWSRMATPIASFTIVEVRKPLVGENKPAAVTADVVVDTRTMRRDVKQEWDALRQHDVLFLTSVAPRDDKAGDVVKAAIAQGSSLGEAYGLRHLRGCEVIEVKDEEGNLMNDFTGRVKYDARKDPVGFLRTVTLALDTAQYQLDVDAMAAAEARGDAPVDVYAGFNLLLRRNPKENNFKAVLESIRDLMNQAASVPDWMHDLFLGYGDPKSALYRQLDGTIRHVDFKDTFLDFEHLKQSFPGFAVKVVGDGGDAPPPPYRLTFPSFNPERASEDLPEGVEEPPDSGTITVQHYKPVLSTPYPAMQPGTNAVRFTPVQIEAVKSGVQPGLTMIVGPPGTGKTDTAVQIMHVLYHNQPQQRTLIIAHSNQALNDLFQKIIQRDVPPRYLLRLGMGEEDLDTDVDFSRTGRVNAMLSRRLELLEEVDKLAKQLAVTADVGYTCETAAYFYLLHVLSRWERFVSEAERRAKAAGEAESAKTVVAELFPFSEYFADAPQPLFKGEDFEDDMERARVCWRHIRTMFTELEECRAFELLKGQADRVNYLVTKHAKIVAMTCTHAALKRREFLSLGFKYDNLLMEEAAQILEIETFIPMLLQEPQDGHNRLKRVILIGDHHQLPPVVKNMAFQKYSHLDQPLFTRFIRLGVPHVELDAQGRARPGIAKLYNWRYKQLGDLPHVHALPQFQACNPGFVYDFQFMDVQPFRGCGESEPTPYFYQNVDEAEAMVRVYMYMRLLGYPAAKISLLTTYNGQKRLLEDVIAHRCANVPAFGAPAKIATVDKYQGQQNEYVLLSLVRTRTVGHLRDVRRLVVASSRARLGLYVFGCRALFEQCYELAPTFHTLLSRPTQLALAPQEQYGVTTRGASEAPAQSVLIENLPQLEGLVDGMAQAAAVRAMYAQQPPPVVTAVPAGP